MPPFTEVFSWLAVIAKPLQALFEAIFSDDPEAERQALLQIQRDIHDEKARRKFGVDQVAMASITPDDPFDPPSGAV